MGLTTKKLQSQIVCQDTPHYFEVVNTSGKRYCHCGNEKDARNLTDMHPGFSYHKIYLPKTPDTVDINSIDMGREKSLPSQNVLPESQQEPLNL